MKDIRYYFEAMLLDKKVRFKKGKGIKDAGLWWSIIAVRGTGCIDVVSEYHHVIKNVSIEDFI